MKVFQLLIFSLLVVSCSNPSERKTLGFVEENGKATAVHVDMALLPNDPSTDSLKVTLRGFAEPILGSTRNEGDYFVFTPVVPFSSGFTYEVSYSGAVVGHVIIIVEGASSVPKIISVFPTVDTLPENILKMYVAFSDPMVEGTALKNIILIRDGTDTIRDAFLDLQPELWNENSTILTLWLDPGRIKRDLIPNRTLGNPLAAGSTYTLVVVPGWKSKAGSETSDVFTRTFSTSPRDEQSPATERWKIDAPGVGTRDPLTISFGEPLDYLSCLNSIFVMNADGEIEHVTKQMGEHELSIRFEPITSWAKGKYFIEVEPRLEDLAGNNLTRLFDQDVTKPAAAQQDGGPIRLRFELR